MPSRKNRHRRFQNAFSAASGQDPLLDLGADHGLTRSRVGNRKAMQLCRQVADTLNYVLSGDSRDDVLRDLYVVQVVPAPDASQLLVLVASAIGQPLHPLSEIQTRLASATPRLRQEVAAAICRKKVPNLLFQFTASSES